ncbi:MAG: 3-deoxy-manno-octulosonate cytidylyltransferase [Candidatus Asgardarchaeia archaeon]
MKYIGIIPARYQSSRFPGKPLCDILGMPMIKRVYDSVMVWDKWDKVFVATDSSDIARKCTDFSIPFIMTKDSHTDCLDRAAEVVERLEDSGTFADRYIVIQGDEPLFNTETLNVDLSPSIVNFYTEVHDPYDMYDSNAVKVVVSRNQKALYFSRYSIPYHDEKTKRTNDDVKIIKQIGVYAFSGEMLKLYSYLKSSPLENMEGIGLNRLIENDIEIHMRYTEHDSISVDTPEDRNRIVEIIKKRSTIKGEDRSI